MIQASPLLSLLVAIEMTYLILLNNYTTYYQNGQQLSQRPTEPGDYSVTLTMNQVSVSGEFTITKAELYK